MSLDTKILNEIVLLSGNPVDFLEGIIQHSGIDERNLVQIFCIYKFKNDLGKKYDRKTYWEESGIEWVESGCAKSFSKLYDQNIPINIIYEEVINDVSFVFPH